MKHRLQNREPLTEQEVIQLLDEHVALMEKKWGTDNFYTEGARKHRDKALEKYRNGEVIEVESINYCDSYGNGTGDYSDVLYSDGHVETYCYGYSD